MLGSLSVTYIKKFVSTFSFPTLLASWYESLIPFVKQFFKVVGYRLNTSGSTILA
uniref:Uncharacterized protein n=1 Tax=Magallana gigas TaxID=29159 RepID=K1RHI0_MAGGI